MYAAVSGISSSLLEVIESEVSVLKLRGVETRQRELVESMLESGLFTDEEICAIRDCSVRFSEEPAETLVGILLYAIEPALLRHIRRIPKEFVGWKKNLREILNDCLDGKDEASFIKQMRECDSKKRLLEAKMAGIVRGFKHGEDALYQEAEVVDRALQSDLKQLQGRVSLLREKRLAELSSMEDRIKSLSEEQLTKIEEMMKIGSSIEEAIRRVVEVEVDLRGVKFG